LQSYRSAAATTPGWEVTHTTLGNALLLGGDRQNAARAYRLAQVAARDVDDRVVYDLTALLAEADVRADDPAFVQNSAFTIDGVRRRVLAQHPSSQVSYDLELGEDTTTLSFQVALDPASWTEPGDGVTFEVALLPHPPVNAEPIQLWSIAIDPKADPADRRWHAAAVDLSAYRGQQVTLILTTGPGSSGDNRFDWAGWGAPRLLKSGAAACCAASSGARAALASPG
jgi:hypothetical protein